MEGDVSLVHHAQVVELLAHSQSEVSQWGLRANYQVFFAAYYSNFVGDNNTESKAARKDDCRGMVG